jgi:hypothetical protein
VTTAYGDVAAAARLVAAVNAGDTGGWVAILAEAAVRGRLGELCLATAAQCASLAGEYFDTDCQTMLDMRALDALSAAQQDGL